ncbi:MAG: MFS transporter [Actinobacteria bacterium]|nr:MFS transporter [Actinomycetota bacterium]
MTLPPAQSQYLDSPRAWLMWALGLLAYVAAVMQRTSFGVAGVLATERFAVGASVVSLFVVVQLLTYAAMQVPAGVLVDRFGTRIVVSCGAALMFLGQLDLAFSTSLVSALIARVLVGAGDAMTFTAVLRILPSWFSAGRIPVLNQLTGMIGQGGQLLSSIPFAALLATVGWTPSFLTLGIASAVVAAVLATLLRNTPPGTARTDAGPPPEIRTQLAEVLREPASRLAFWIHWMSGFWPMVFAAMWGYPFLINGLGYPQPVASGLFTVLVLAGAPLAPLVGVLSRRAPLQRTNLALIVSSMCAVPWLAILLWPGVAPVWLLVVLMIGMAASGPGSGIGFDIVRAANPLRHIGTASGMIIVGGFFAALVNIWVIGIVLDLLGGYSLDAFKWAMSTQFLFWTIGVVGAYTARARTRRRDRERGVRHTPLLTVLRREVSNLLVEWHIFRSPASVGGTTGTLQLTLDDERTVDVAALIPGTAGRLAAIDVPPPGATDEWWRARVGDYLDLVATEDLEIGSIEVRCADSPTTARVRALVAGELARRDAGLTYEVVTRGH